MKKLPANTISAVEIAQKQRHLFLLGKIKSNQHLTKSELDELEELETRAKNKKKAQSGKGTKAQSNKAAIADNQIIKTQKEASEYASVNTRTVRRWAKADMPLTKDGYYIKSMLDFYKKNEGQQPTEDKNRQQKAEADLKETKAKLAQMELELKTGELIRREDIEKGRIARIQAVKRGLLGLGRKLAKRVAAIKNPRKIEAIITEEVRYLIEGFAGS